LTPVVRRGRLSTAGSITDSAAGSWLLGSSNTVASVVFIIATKSPTLKRAIQAAKSKALHG
jgi:hypothetical protein